MPIGAASSEARWQAAVPPVSAAGGATGQRHPGGLTSLTLSLSTRVAEEFLSKEKASMSLAELADLALASGYEAVCMRASQIGIHSSAEQVARAREILAARRLRVSMITGDFAVVYNNARGPDCLRNIAPYIRLARALESPLIRVAVKSEADIEWAQRAADEAAAEGVGLAHQCHTQSLFETLDGIERTLDRINRPNFGLIYEPANLELCGQDYGLLGIRRLAARIVNVYLQNQILKPDGSLTLDTWCRGAVSFDLIPVHAPGGIQFDAVFDGLAAIRYRGPVTLHQAGAPGDPAGPSARASAAYIQSQLARTRPPLSPERPGYNSVL